MRQARSRSEEILIAVAVDRDKVLQAAQKLVEKKRYDKAVAEYQKLVAEDPKDVRTLLKIGDLYLKMEQYVDAITTYEGVGQFYSAQGFHLKAIAVYKQIREIVHKFVPHMEDRFGHIVPKLAEIYTQLGLTSDALAAYEEVAGRFQRAGRDRDAIDIFRKVVDLDPTNPLAQLRLGEAFVRVRDLDSAIERFGAAAELLLKLGRRDDALKVVERLLQHRPDTKFARLAAEIYLERGEPSDGMAALAKLQICFKENPRDLDTLALLARAFDKLGQPPKAIEVQKEAARIAREANKLDHFNALVDTLLARAPNDEGVRHLASLRAPPSLPAPSVDAAPASAVEVEVEEEEVILDEEDAVPIESEAPFVLRPSIAPPAASPAEVDPTAARVRQVLAQVEALRRARDPEQAVALLFEAVDALPAARELREKLCDLLIETGDQAEAVRQMLAFARSVAHAGDVEGAARLLDEVLLLEPGQRDALAMLQELGYAVQGGDAYPAEQQAAYPAPASSGPGYDPNAPLPSYDLDDAANPAASGRAFLASQLDDPFAADLPLPSFPMEEEEASQYAAAAYDRDSADLARPSDPTQESASPPTDPQPVVQLDEAALEEVDFYAAQGLFDDARALLDEQILRLPNHPLLLERKRELEEQAAAASGSGTRVVPRRISVPPVNGVPTEDRSFDIAASLDALDALDAGPPPAADPNQVSVESVFEQFKAGVAAQISESDAATHYDLGVAYREMGLYSDAISEFELAARDPNRECVCQSMIGMIYRGLDNVDAAIDAFIRGLHASIKTREQDLALTYEIGDAYESRRTNDQALYYFQRVQRVDPAYTDPRGSIAERVRRLDRPAPPPVARAVGAEEIGDEFDAALDDLLGGGKLP